MQVIDEMCRVCLGKHRLNPIFEKNRPEKIVYCASVQVSIDDELPKMICNQCLFYLDVAYLFRTVCEATDAKLRKHISQLKEKAVQDSSDDFHFNNSPVAHEVVIGDDDKEIEINVPPPEEHPEKTRDKPKVGRHVAKKNAGKYPQRVPPLHNTPNSKRSGDKTYQCTTCDKFFSFKSHLVRHMSVHSDIKKYSCSYCNKKFINRYNLSVHLQKHTGDFPLKCKICNRGFSSPSLLKRHLNSHAGTPKLQCKYCPKKLLYASSLKLHEKMHLYRPSYTCDVCFKVFAYTNSLTEHKKTHQGIKEFACGVCYKTFTRKTSLRRHAAGHSQRGRKKNQNSI
ncbi:zinc finger protein 501-like [Tribolium madens]|uniref:zinc finger protein 501-like n=1 Tax=Tribolium madens TaxID=41895 RepID=UPI001CF74BCA|nr:zinc finger protein 501-like [Tribolium madens]